MNREGWCEFGVKEQYRFVSARLLFAEWLSFVKMKTPLIN